MKYLIYKLGALAISACKTTPCNVIREIKFRQREGYPDIFPNDLKNLTEESNPVISFYRVKR